MAAFPKYADLGGGTRIRSGDRREEGDHPPAPEREIANAIENPPPPERAVGSQWVDGSERVLGQALQTSIVERVRTAASNRACGRS